MKIMLLTVAVIAQKARNCTCTAGLLKREAGLLNCICSEDIIWVKNCVVGNFMALLECNGHLPKLVFEYCGQDKQRFANKVL